ncbi:MAG TPA: DNA adenine methylase [Rhodothermales bacterium]|nr:DNA adenine methylase [Rhodothermales bacterium]
MLRYHGGKWMLAPWIIAHFPPHRIYTEAYGGAGSVLMRKAPAPFLEVWNDLDSEIANLFRVLRDDEQNARLCWLLDRTEYGREQFRLSYEPSPDPVEQARRTVVRSFMGFGSDAASGTRTGFRANGNRQTSHPASDWQNLPPSLAAVKHRLRGVEIENRPAIKVLLQHDEPRALHYVDPPYVHETRKASMLRTGKGYRHEMTTEDHHALAQVLHGLEGMVVLSGYACPLYDEDLYAGWYRVERPALADQASPRTEVLWLNAAAMRGLSQPSLFS